MPSSSHPHSDPKPRPSSAAPSSAAPFNHPIGGVLPALPKPPLRPAPRTLTPPAAPIASSPPPPKAIARQPQPQHLQQRRRFKNNPSQNSAVQHLPPIQPHTHTPPLPSRRTSSAAHDRPPHYATLRYSPVYGVAHSAVLLPLLLLLLLLLRTVDIAMRNSVDSYPNLLQF